MPSYRLLLIVVVFVRAGVVNGLQLDQRDVDDDGRRWLLQTQRHQDCEDC